MTRVSVPRLGHSCPAGAASCCPPCLADLSVYPTPSSPSIWLPIWETNSKLAQFLTTGKETPPKKPWKAPGSEYRVGMLRPIPAALPAFSAPSTSPFSWVLAARGQIFPVFLQPHRGSEVSWSLSPPCPVLLLSRAVLWESLPALGGNYADLCFSCDLLVAGGISRVIYYAN